MLSYHILFLVLALTLGNQDCVSDQDCVTDQDCVSDQNCVSDQDCDEGLVCVECVWPESENSDYCCWPPHNPG